MNATAQLLEGLVSITQFNKGQASRIFDRLKGLRQMVVLKNNEPVAVMLSPEEYSRLSEAEENLFLLNEAVARMERSKGKPTYTMEESMAEMGVTQADLDAMDEVEFE